MSIGLIIVESPAKSHTISKFLHGNYQVKASMGHVRDLPKKEFGINIEKNFEPKYVVDKAKLKIISELKDAVSKVDTVYLASDHDREGEAISWHLAQLMAKELKGKKIYRIVFNEITSSAINDSLLHPGEIDMNKVNAQQARRILDRIVGYQISPLLWKVIAKDLSAGRVQSVALRLICEREDEICNFIPKEYWRISAEFHRDDLPSFTAVLDKINGKKVEIPNQTDAEQLLADIKDKNAILQELKRVNKDVEPLPPFITSTLQQEASKLLNMQAQKTMSIAQELYEGIDLKGESTGLISYMRTDSIRIAAEANVACRDLIAERFGKDYVHGKTRQYKNKNAAQDAHEAIRPTDPFRTPESLAPFLSKDQLKLYTLIWQRFIATQMRPAKLLQSTVNVAVGNALFNATGNQIIEQGFIKVYPHYSIPAGEVIHSDYQINDILEYENLISTQNFTSPPSRYTEASLIKELEAKGIGRPSTYATILTTIRQRDYVKMEKKSFVPTTIGMDVNRFLVSKFDALFNTKFTAEMEEKLDEVEYGKVDWKDLLAEYYTDVQKLIGLVDIKKEKSEFTEITEIVCDVCHVGKMVIKRNKRGEFLSCSEYPKCKNIRQFIRTKEGKIEYKAVETLDEQCPQCGSPLLVKSGKFGSFIACSTYPKCKYTRALTTGIKCPECGKGEITEKRSKKGKRFYSCSAYPECKWISNDKPVALTCPNCGNDYLVEKYDNNKGTFKQCPKCKHEVY